MAQTGRCFLTKVLLIGGAGAALLGLAANRAEIPEAWRYWNAVLFTGEHHGICYQSRISGWQVLLESGPPKKGEVNIVDPSQCGPEDISPYVSPEKQKEIEERLRRGTEAD